MDRVPPGRKLRQSPGPDFFPLADWYRDRGQYDARESAGSRHVDHGGPPALDDAAPWAVAPYRKSGRRPGLRPIDPR